jgi:hypothetical protein
MAKGGLELVPNEGVKTAKGRSAKPRNNGKKDAKRAAETNPPAETKPRAVPARSRVRKAQLSVLEKVESILEGNCKSATKGNHGCAKFVLDWSGVSDLRTPLAKPKRKSSLTDALLKRLKHAAEQKPKAGEAPEQK